MLQRRSFTKNRVMQMLNAPDKGISRTHGVTGTLSRLFRRILLDLNVSGPRFHALLTQYVAEAKEGTADNHKDRTSMRGNLTKEFIREQMTWKVFLKALRFLKFARVEIHLRAYHYNGSVSTHSEMINLRLDEPTSKFEAELEQPEHQEAPGEHVAYLDDFFEQQREGLLSTAHSLDIPKTVNLNDQHWYVYSPSTQLIYDDLGYRFTSDMSDVALLRLNDQFLNKWRDTQEDVQLSKGADLQGKVRGYFTEKPTVAPPQAHPGHGAHGKPLARIDDDDWYIWSPAKKLVYERFDRKQLGSLAKYPAPSQHPDVAPALERWRQTDASATFNRGMQLYGFKLEWDSSSQGEDKPS